MSPDPAARSPTGEQLLDVHFKCRDLGVNNASVHFVKAQLIPNLFRAANKRCTAPNLLSRFGIPIHNLDRAREA